MSPNRGLIPITALCVDPSQWNMRCDKGGITAGHRMDVTNVYV